MAGVYATETRSAGEPLISEAAGLRVLACSIFGGFFALYMLSAVDSMLGFTDAGAMLAAADALLRHGIGPAEAQMHDKWCLGQVLIDVIIVQIDRLCSGSSLQALVQPRVQAALPAMFGAGMPTLAFLIGIRLSYSRLTSVLSALCVGLGMITWVYTQALFAEGTLALLWLLVIYAMVSFAQTDRLGWLALAGLAGGYALITKAATAAALPVLPLWVLGVYLQRSRASALDLRKVIAALAVLTLPLLAFAALNLWYNYARFGNVLDSGYNVERDGESGGFTTTLLVGLFGLLLSPGKGFFFYNPIAVLGLFGIGPFLRQHRLAGRSILAIICILMLVHARWWAWHGDWAWGPRFMVPLAPLFGLFTLSAIARATHRAASFRSLRLLLMAALLQISIGVQVLGLAFDPSRYIDLVTDKCGILRNGSYFREGKFPLLDDGFILHFVPQFSPISGHAWMLRAALAADESRRAAILRHPPWRKLNPLWVPKTVSELNTRLEFWWMPGQSDKAKRHAPALVLTIALSLLLLGSAFALVRRLRAASPSENSNL